MTAGGEIVVERDGSVWRLRIDNPSRRNAMTAAMWSQIAEACAEIDASDARVLLVYGAEGTFCSGAAINDFDEQRANPATAQDYDDRVEAGCLAIQSLSIPAIAQIEGACAGAGLSIAASCDLRLAASDAKLLMPAARLGLGYDPRGLKRFQATFGDAFTRELILTAQGIGADRAHTLGVVNRLSAPENAATDAQHWAERLAENAPLTLAAAKKTLRALAAPEASDLWQAALDSLAEADASDDYQEGRRAFAEKRKPRFQGR